MKLVWKSRIPIDKDSYIQIYDFYKELFSFGENDENLVCFFSTIDTSSAPPHDLYIHAAKVKKDSGEVEKFSFKLKKGASPIIPDFWAAEKSGSAIKLDMGKYAPASEKQDRRLLTFCEDGLFDLKEKLPPQGKMVFNSSKEYLFGNLKISIAENFTRKLQCVNTETNQTLWNFKFVGYLYTEIKEHNGVIYFGTAGQGGHFYGLDIESGLPVHDINTRGTTVFSIYENEIYLPSQYGDLVKYNPDNRYCEELNVGKNCYINDEVNFAIEGDRLYTVIAERSKAEGRLIFYAACVDLND